MSTNEMFRNAPLAILIGAFALGGCMMEGDDEPTTEDRELVEDGDAPERFVETEDDDDEPAVCELDADCGRDAWCGKDYDGLAACHDYAELGELCGGYMPFGMSPRCAVGLTCVFDDPHPDMPGTCMGRRDADIGE